MQMQMQRTKYAPEFKDEAIKQVVIRGRSVVDVTKRIGIPEGVLYMWVGKVKKADELVNNDLTVLQSEMVKLKTELGRTTEERDILKKPPRTLQNSPSEVRVHSSP